MNNLLRTIIAGYGAKKLGGGSFGVTNALKGNNVAVTGEGKNVMLFAHGLG